MARAVKFVNELGQVRWQPETSDGRRAWGQLLPQSWGRLLPQFWATEEEWGADHTRFMVSEERNAIDIAERHERSEKKGVWREVRELPALLVPTDKEVREYYANYASSKHLGVTFGEALMRYDQWYDARFREYRESIAKEIEAMADDMGDPDQLWRSTIMGVAQRVRKL